VRIIASDVARSVTFFCGGSRSFAKVIDLFDTVLVFDVDLDTLLRRLKQRPEHEFGGKQSARDVVALQNRTHRNRLLDRRVPDNAILIDARQPLVEVVDEVLRRAAEIDRAKEAATTRTSGSVR
jgi:hypothetical protein